VAEEFGKIESAPTALTHARFEWVRKCKELMDSSRSAFSVCVRPFKLEPVTANAVLGMIHADFKYMLGVIESSIERETQHLAECTKMRDEAANNLSRLSEMTPEQRTIILAHVEATAKAQSADAALERKNDESARIEREAQDRSEKTIKEASEHFLAAIDAQPYATLNDLINQTLRLFPVSREDLETSVESMEIGPGKPASALRRDLYTLIEFARQVSLDPKQDGRFGSNLAKFVDQALFTPPGADPSQRAYDMKKTDLGTNLRLILSIALLNGSVPDKDGNTYASYLSELQNVRGVDLRNSRKHTLAGRHSAIARQFRHYLADAHGNIAINPYPPGSNVSYRVFKLAALEATSTSNARQSNARQSDEVFFPKEIVEMVGIARLYTDEMNANLGASGMTLESYTELMRGLSCVRVSSFVKRVPASWREIIGGSGAFSDLPGVLWVATVSVESAIDAMKAEFTKQRERSVALARIWALAAETERRDILDFRNEVHLAFPASRDLLNHMKIFMGSEPRARLQARGDALWKAGIDQRYRDDFDADLDNFLRRGGPVTCQLNPFRMLLPAITTKDRESMSPAQLNEWVRTQTDGMPWRRTGPAHPMPATPESSRLAIYGKIMDMMENPLIVSTLHIIMDGNIRNKSRVAKLLVQNPTAAKMQAVCSRIEVSAAALMLVLSEGGRFQTLDELFRGSSGIPANAFAGWITDPGPVGKFVIRELSQVLREINRNIDAGSIKQRDAQIQGALKARFGKSLPQERRDRFLAFISNLALTYGLEPIGYVAEARALFSELPLDVKLGDFAFLGYMVSLMANSARSGILLKVMLFNSYRDSAVLRAVNLIASMHRDSHGPGLVRVLDASNVLDAREFLTDSGVQWDGCAIFVGGAWTIMKETLALIKKHFVHVMFVKNDERVAPIFMQLRAAVESKSVISAPPAPDGQTRGAAKWKGKKTVTGDSLVSTRESQWGTCAAMLSVDTQRATPELIVHWCNVASQYASTRYLNEKGSSRHDFNAWTIILTANPPTARAIVTIPDAVDYADENCDKTFL
jgi:hypothetical protein